MRIEQLNKQFFRRRLLAKDDNKLVLRNNEGFRALTLEREDSRRMSKSRITFEIDKLLSELRSTVIFFLLNVLERFGWRSSSTKSLQVT